MKPNNIFLNSKTPTAGQMQKYLAGELNVDEQHQMERYLLENKADNEALEGLNSVNNPSVVADDLSELQKRIKERVREDEKIMLNPPLRIWKYNPMNIAIAATVVVLLISTGTLFTLRWQQNHLKNQPEQIASVPKNNISGEDKTALIPPVISENDEEKSKIEETKIEKNKKSDNENNNKPLKTDYLTLEKTEAEKPVENIIQENNIEKKEESAVTETKTDWKKDEKISDEKKYPNVGVLSDNELDKGKAIQKSESSSNLLEGKSISKAKKSAAIVKEPLLVSGKITDENGNELPGVNVFVKDSKEGVVSDSDGNYSISVPVESTIEYAYIGYSTAEKKATGENIDIRLKPDEKSLNEVVVVAYGSDETKKENEQKFFSTEPLTGYIKYKQYITTNLQYPQEAINNNIEGHVTLSFYVNTDRQLTDFKIRKSLGYGCDEEAVRLIKEGPKWGPANYQGKPVKQKVRMRVRFKLNK